MWVKKLDADELGVTFMPRSMDPLDNKQNKYDNMVEDEEEFVEFELEPQPSLSIEDEENVLEFLEPLGEHQIVSQQETEDWYRKEYLKGSIYL